MKKALAKAECTAIIMAVAQKNGVSPVEVRRGIGQSIDDIWSCQTPSSVEYRYRLFAQKRPTIEEFLYKTTQSVKEQGFL